MRILLFVLVCGVLFSTSSFCSCKTQNYLKEFVNDIIKLDNEALLGKYFPDLENRVCADSDSIEATKIYSDALDEIRTKINAKKKIVIDEIEDRVYKVSQKDYFFYVKLKENDDLIESFIAIRKRERILGWV